jgi:hypothetical protein
MKRYRGCWRKLFALVRFTHRRYFGKAELVSLCVWGWKAGILSKNHSFPCNPLQAKPADPLQVGPFKMFVSRNGLPFILKIIIITLNVMAHTCNP